MFSLSTLKKISKTTLLSFVFVIVFFAIPTVASAQLFTAGSGVGTIKSVGYDATTGTDTFSAVTGFQFESSDTELGQLWQQIYQRVESGALGLYYGPTKKAGSFIIRTYESDKDGNPVNPGRVDADKNPEDTLITIPEQDVRYTNASAFLNLWPGNAASSIIQGRLGLFSDSTNALSKFYKYAKGDNNKVGASEVVVSQIKTKNKIAPGSFVTVDFWYCPQTNYDGTTSIGTTPGFVDMAPGLVIDAATQQIDGITKLRSSSVLFPDKKFTISDPGFRYGGSPCASYLDKDGAHAKRGVLRDDAIKTVVHGTYFRIGKNTYPIPMSAAQNAAEQQNTATGLTIQNNAQSKENGFLPGCGVFDKESSIMGCIAQGIYYIVYVPIQWFAGILGQLFDFFLGYSLSDASYRAQFAVRGWQIVRDLSNIFFIIILVYTGLMAVFNTKTNIKSVLPALILNALLINFSLFGVRVVIDISNVVARVFYKSVHVCTGECKDDLSNAKQGIGGFVPLSEKILSSFNPQKLMSAEVLDQARAVKSTSGGAVGQATSGVSTSYRSGDTGSDKASAGTIAGYFIIVTLIAAFIMFGIAMMFWKTAFFFVGRVIGLYFCMIFAPFAVLSRGGMPIVSGIKELSWDKLTDDLIQYSLLAPIFVFFLYVIYSFLDTDFLKVYTDQGQGSFIETAVYIAIPMIIVYFMISKGVSLAEKYAGSLGKSITGGINKVLGAGAGVALGGAAFLGRNGVGRVLGAIGSSGKRTEMIDGKEVETTRAQRWAANANNSWGGRMWNNTYSKTQTGSWDARNVGIKIGKKEYGLESAMGGLGLKDGVSSILGIGKEKALGKDGKAGGNVAIDKKRAEKRAKELEARINMSHLSDDDAKTAGKKYKDDQAKKDAEKNWENHVDKEDAVKAAAAALARTKEEVAQAQADLTQAEQSNNQTKILVAKSALKHAQDDEQAAQLQLTDISAQTIESLKQNGAHKNSKAYEAAVAAKMKDLNKYNVKDGASFTAMMRAEYVEKLKDQSYFRRMLDEVTSGSNIGATIVGGTLAALIPPLAPVIGAALTGMFTTAITDALGDPNKKGKFSNITGNAVASIIKKATQKSGTGNVLVDMEERLEQHKNMLLSSINKMQADKGGVPYDSYDKLGATEEDIENLIIERTVHLEEQQDRFDQDIKNQSLTPAQREQAKINKAKTIRELNKLKNVQKDIADMKEKIDRHKEQKKKEEEGKNKKGDDDKPKPEK